MGIMAFAGFGVFAWAWRVDEISTGGTLLAAGVWLFLRATGFMSGCWVAPCITAATATAVAMVVMFKSPADSAVLRFFSPTAFLTTLAVMLPIDLLELLPSSGIARCRLIADRQKHASWKSLIICALVACFVVYMVIMPAAAEIRDRVQPLKSGVVEDMSLAESIRVQTTEAFVAVWFFALGATVGSFLNVVAYRMPRGESVVLRRSRCPQCAAAISARDNIPIFGWLQLGGKCRHCAAGISVRYPLVEFTSAALFLLLYFVELISGGANIPIREPNYYHGVVWILLYTKWDLVRLYLYHCLLISVLLTWLLIDLDGTRATRRAKWIVASLLGAIPLAFPDLLPVAYTAGAPRWLPERWMVTAASSLIGGMVGAAAGASIQLLPWAACLSTVRDSSTNLLEQNAFPRHCYHQSHVCGALSFIGLALGWQAVLMIAMVAIALHAGFLVCSRYHRRSIPPMTFFVLAAFVVHHIAWRWLAQ
jgi:leader peptidase (prepilin peptidase)/N-methyltransferase